MANKKAAVKKVAPKKAAAKKSTPKVSNTSIAAEQAPEEEKVLASHEYVALVRKSIATGEGISKCMALCPGVPLSELEHTLITKLQYGSIKINQL